LDKQKIQPEHRIFFALWPSDLVRQNIETAFSLTAQSKMKGRVMLPSNLHMTLHFVGNVSEKKMACLHQAAQTVSVNSFELTLDHYGYFYKPKVLWMGLEQIPPALKQLHNRLANAFMACDYQSENRPYSPHVTLMRKLSAPGYLNNPDPVVWQVNDFVLVESVPIDGGVKYKVIEKYSL